MPLTYTQTVPPVLEPVSVDEAARFARVDDVQLEGALLTALIQAAREQVETLTRRQLITATFALSLDRFPAVIRPPKPPLQSVSSISYTDTDGNVQVLDSSLYTVDIVSIPGRIQPAYNETWPATRRVLNAITVTYVAGHGALGATVPARARAAIQLLIADMYEHREYQFLGVSRTQNPTMQRLLSGLIIPEVV